MCNPKIKTISNQDNQLSNITCNVFFRPHKNYIINKFFTLTSYQGERCLITEKSTETKLVIATISALDFSSRNVEEKGPTCSEIIGNNFW